MGDVLDASLFPFALVLRFICKPDGEKTEKSQPKADDEGKGGRGELYPQAHAKSGCGCARARKERERAK